MSLSSAYSGCFAFNLQTPAAEVPMQSIHFTYRPFSRSPLQGPSSSIFLYVFLEALSIWPGMS